MSSKLIAPSVLAADFANLQRDVEMINTSQADWFHIDIMDGVFVPNISFGMPVLRDIAKHANKTIDVHLMIVDPDRYIQTFADLGSSILTVHYEACTHLHRSLQAINKNTYKKVTALREIIVRNNASTLIEIDGGVTDKNAKQLVDAGADVLVAGSYVFKSDNPTKTIEGLKTLVNN